jgi:toxin ParE1/3/4
VTQPPLILSPLAEDDLVEIGTFIARDSLPRAIKFVDELEEFLGVLANAPGIGRIRHDLAGAPHSAAFRRFPYLIFYEPLEDGGIRVLRVLHGARDIGQIFGPH